jgi:hypothetical protein
MAHKLIKTENYLLVVDDNKDIEENMWTVKEGKVREVSYLGQDNGYAIIAHLPLNGSPILEGVDLLPPYEDVELLIKDALSDLPKNLDKTNLYALGFTEGRISGYNKARQKYKYTEEDMRKAIDMATTSKHDSTLIFFNAEEIIQSLHQYPTEFECEMKYFEVDMGLGEECIEHGQIPQKITTAQGRQWVGKYK